MKEYKVLRRVLSKMLEKTLAPLAKEGWTIVPGSVDWTQTQQYVGLILERPVVEKLEKA